VVIHKVEGKAPKVGTTVKCHVEMRRRRRITQIHTATHIINGTSRQVLGPWVWQHSAFKEEDYGRIDITHFAHLTTAEVQKIEDLANEIVRKDLKVTNTFMLRQVAEEKYGFRLYQGGVVPGKLVRVVNIGGWDIEACGGTHTKRTGEVGLVKIIKVERIQDGVERIHFVAGEAAIEYVHRMDSELAELSGVLGTQRENLVKVVQSLQNDLEDTRARVKALRQQTMEAPSEAVGSSIPLDDVSVSVFRTEELADEDVIARGQTAVKSNPKTIFVGLVTRGSSTRIICFVGSLAQTGGYSASAVVRSFAPLLGGSGGGTTSFDQGGGPVLDSQKIQEITEKIPDIVRSAKV